MLSFHTSYLFIAVFNIHAVRLSLYVHATFSFFTDYFSGPD